jgi:hypothetical protein
MAAWPLAVMVDNLTDTFNEIVHSPPPNVAGDSFYALSVAPMDS